jgi:hypothetical protein
MSDLYAEARRRSGFHDGQQPERRFTPAYEIIGLIAERDWSALTGAPRPDTEAIGAGSDGGHDFEHKVWAENWSVATLLVDVKGAQKPYGLLVEAGKVRKNVAYVLGLVDLSGQRVSAWLGYAWGAEVLQYPPRAWPRHVVNHVVPVAKLRPVAELLDRMLF